MGVVVFDPFAFKVRYPEFNAIPNPTLGAYFLEAEQYLNNKPTSPVPCISRRVILLNMLVAHIAALGGALTPSGQAAPVGRVADATEGSVSVSLDYMPATAGSGAWFNQTQYGAAFWQATSSLRGFRYVPRFAQAFVPNRFIGRI